MNVDDGGKLIDLCYKNGWYSEKEAANAKSKWYSEMKNDDVPQQWIDSALRQNPCSVRML